MVMDKLKLIGVRDETKAILDSMKIVPSETYDSIINRMIEELKGEEKHEPEPERLL